MKKIYNENKKAGDIFERTIKSNIFEVKMLITDALRFVDSIGEYSDSKRSDIRVVISELLVNAFYHGNKGDGTKDIKLQILPYKENQLLISVEDEGRGLSKKILKEKKKSGRKNKPTLEEDGRGLMIISELTNKVFTRGEGKKICTMMSTKDQEMK